MQDHIDALIVHAEIPLQILDEVRTRNLPVGEVRSRGSLLRNEPALLEPELERLDLDARARQEFTLAHMRAHDALPSRGLNSLAFVQLDTKASSSGSGDFGKTIFSLTNSSPCPPLRRGAPLPFRRSVVPVFDPFGTDMVTSPVGV